MVAASKVLSGEWGKNGMEVSSWKMSGIVAKRNQWSLTPLIHDPLIQGLTPHMYCALCAAARWMLIIMVCPLFFFPPALAKENEASAEQKTEYNYNAVCLFMDFMLGYQLPNIKNVLLLDKYHVEEISAENLVKEIKHVEKNIKMYRYTSDGVQADFVKTFSNTFYIRVHLRANKVPEDMRTKKYLFPILQIKNVNESADSILLGCDGTEMVLKFNGDELVTLDISASID